MCIRDSKIAKELLPDLLEGAAEADGVAALVEARGMAQISDEGAIRELVQTVIDEHPDEVSKFRCALSPSRTCRSLSDVFMHTTACATTCRLVDWPARAVQGWEEEAVGLFPGSGDEGVGGASEPADARAPPRAHALRRRLISRPRLPARLLA